MAEKVTIEVLPNTGVRGDSLVQSVLFYATDYAKSHGLFVRQSQTGHTVHLEFTAHDIPNLQDTIDRLDAISREMGVPLATLLKAVAEDTQQRINEFRKG